MSAGNQETAAVSAATAAGPSFLTFLDAAATPWSRLPYFPEYDAKEQRDGDQLVAEMDTLLAKVDSNDIDSTGTLPDGLVDDLRAAGFLAVSNDVADGGRQATNYNAFRVVARASRTSVGLGQMLGVQNGIGAMAVLPTLPPGPLREFVARYVSTGTISGTSDTEPAGQNNSWRNTTAKLTKDGTAYLLNGDKKFAGNGPAAGMIGVTAAIQGKDGQPRLGLVFVDTTSAGVTITAEHEFIGSRGIPSGSLNFKAVHVPADQVLLSEGPTSSNQPPSVGRLLINAAPALAIARECLNVGREFIASRVVDGRPLGDYDQIQRFTANTLAEIYAMDSVMRWCLLGDGDRGFEQLLAKNITTVAAYRIADATVSILGAEGLETVASKLRRGGAPLPAERLLRDARVLRIAGNVDFMLDIQAGRALLTRHSQSTGPYESWRYPIDCAGLSPANCEHLLALVSDQRRLSRTCTDLALRYSDLDTVPGGQETHRVIGRIAGVLLGMFAVLTRAGHVDTDKDLRSELADLHCTNALHELTNLWHELSAPAPDYAKLSGGVSTDPVPDFLTEL